MRPTFSNHRRALLGALLFAAAFGYACSRSDAPVDRQAATPTRSEPALATPVAAGEHGASDLHGDHAFDPASCPTAVAGTTVRAMDTGDGAALELTTTGDVAAVRARARKLAEHRGMPRVASAGTQGAGHAMGGPGHMMGHAMVDAHVRVQDIDGGVRIELTPRVSAELEAVRAHAGHLAQRLQAGDCAAATMMMM